MVYQDSPVRSCGSAAFTGVLISGWDCTTL